MIRRRFQQLRHWFKAMDRAIHEVASMQQLAIANEIDRLRESKRYDDPKHLIRYGHKLYSQCDEDGIIAEIFNRIGTTNKYFVEFGIGNGLENNTIALLFDHWQGLWIDASKESVEAIRMSFARLVQSGKLKVVESFIRKDNINELIEANSKRGEIDLLSVDIDGNDYHVLSAITCIQPRVIAIEYNSKFPPPVLYCMSYDAAHYWRGGDCFGASLKFLELQLHDKGYLLVGCNLTGANAFFVRRDLVADKFLEPFSAENHYEPARYYLAEFASGHPATYDTLSRAIENQR